VLHIGSPKTRASRRTVGLPRFVAEELAAQADTALRDRLDALYGTAQPTPDGTVVRLPRRAGRGPSVAPGGPRNDESAADDVPTTL
jgi:hypothetical protein